MPSGMAVTMMMIIRASLRIRCEYAKHSRCS
jgi:hypothetical protein